MQSRDRIYIDPRSSDVYYAQNKISSTYYGNFWIANDQKNTQLLIRVSEPSQIHFQELQNKRKYSASYVNTLRPLKSFIDNNTGMIVSLYGSDFIPYQTLLSYIQRQTNVNTFESHQIPFIKSIFPKLLQAMESIHKQGILIKDLHLSHILVSKEGLVRISAVGTEEQKAFRQIFLAHEEKEKNQIPEFLKMENNVVYSKESDNYRLGLILFRLMYLPKLHEYYHAQENKRLDQFIQNELLYTQIPNELLIYKEILQGLLKVKPHERETPSKSLEVLKAQKSLIQESILNRQIVNTEENDNQEQLEESKVIEQNNNEEQSIQEANIDNNNNNNNEDININNHDPKQSGFFSNNISIVIIFPLLISFFVYFILPYCYAEYYYNKGISLAQENKIETALKYFDQALKNNFQMEEAYFQKGYLLQNQEKYEKAIENYLEVLRLNQNNEYAFDNLGLIYFKNKIYKKAQLCFEQALKQNPDFESAKQNIKALKDQGVHGDKILEDVVEVIKFLER